MILTKFHERQANLEPFQSWSVEETLVCRIKSGQQSACLEFLRSFQSTDNNFPKGRRSDNRKQRKLLIEQ